MFQAKQASWMVWLEFYLPLYYKNNIRSQLFSGTGKTVEDYNGAPARNEWLSVLHLCLKYFINKGHGFRKEL